MSNTNMPLWHSCQRIVYPNRFPSNNDPFPTKVKMGPKVKPASWLYHLLTGDPALRAKVLP